MKRYDLIGSVLGLLVFSYFFIKELDFLITNRESVATVENKEETNGKTKIHVSFYSVYEGEKRTGLFKVYVDVAETIAPGDHLTIRYQKNFSSIYSEYKKPPTYLWTILSFFMWALSIYSIVFHGRKLIGR